MKYILLILVNSNNTQKLSWKMYFAPTIQLYRMLQSTDSSYFMTILTEKCEIRMLISAEKDLLKGLFFVTKLASIFQALIHA